MRGKQGAWSRQMPASRAGVCLGKRLSWRNPYASSVLGVKTNPTVHKYTANQSSMSRYLLARGQNRGKFHMERPRTVPEHLGHTSVASAYGHFASIFLKSFDYFIKFPICGGYGRIYGVAGNAISSVPKK